MFGRMMRSTEEEGGTENGNKKNRQIEAGRNEQTNLRHAKRGGEWR